MQIEDVVVLKVTGRIPSRALGLPRSGAESDDPQPLEHYYLEVVSHGGPDGLYGPVREDQAFHIAANLRPALIGMDPLAGTHVWAELARRFRRHGRTGIFMMAISAVDNALWDLRGKHFAVPVYRLLGGPTRPRIRAYASMLGRAGNPQEAAEHARQAVEAGYRAEKWFFPARQGSVPGERARNMECARAVRGAVGDEVELMFDAVMGWDLEFALKMARALVEVNPKWLEEPVHACQPDGFARIKRETGIPLAAGEHLYTRWDVRPYLERQLLDFVQADPDWTGGITELTRICALAESHGVKVCPHGHTVNAAAHVIASQPESVCPLLEYLVRWAPRQQWFQKNPPVPEDGFVELPEAPGLGIELDEDKIEHQEVVSWP